MNYYKGILNNGSCSFRIAVLDIWQVPCRGEQMDQPKTSEKWPKRLPYEQPKFVKHGSLTELTQTAGKSGGDGAASLHSRP